MKSVFLRADSNHEIGSGHLTRMIALGEILRDDFKVTLVTKTHVSTSFKLLEIRDEEEFVEVLNNEAIAVLDGYHFDKVLQKKIIERSSKLVCIDDHQHQTYLADLIINHAPGVEEEQINGRLETRYLLGPKYALLRKPFLESSLQRNKGSYSNAMICFGGSDVNDLSYKFTEALLKTSSINSVDLVLGRDYNGKCKSLADTRLTISSGLNDLEMKGLMQENEFAIVPSSTILFECLSQNTPCISGYYVDNQSLIYNGFLKEKAIVGLGDLRSCSDDEIKNVIDQRMNRLDSLNIQGIFDDQIRERLISEFRAL